ncbi:hypothetical protein D3C85_1518260 [compost metagenome]
MGACAIHHEQRAFRVRRQNVRSDQTPRNIQGSRHMTALIGVRAAHIQQDEVHFIGLLAGKHVRTVGFKGQAIAEMHQGNG